MKASCSQLSTSVWAAIVAAGGLCVSTARAADLPQFTGTLAGMVTNGVGIPQMGAAVVLYDRYDRLLARALTNDKGVFLFDALNPESYAVRVSLASFVPAVRRGVAIQSGVRSFLAINLSSVFSSVELVYMSPGQGPIMSDEWKWVLRSSTATRPVLRIMPGVDPLGLPRQARHESAIFSDTRGVVRVSAGDGGSVSAAGNQPDLGTAFALATSLFGANQLQFSGNVGYSSRTGIPSAGFRTSFSRNASGELFTPTVNLTMQQVYLPARAGASFISGRQDDAPMLRTMTLSTVDRKRISPDLEFQYGGSLESVSFLNRLNYVSPFARVRWGTLDLGALEIAFSSGAPAVELLATGEAGDVELQDQINTLSMFPRVSVRGGSARVQRTQNYEIGYRRSFARRSVSAGVYRESVRNAAFTMAAPAGFYSSELLPDLASNSSVFNAGTFRRTGYHFAVSQQLLDDLQATIAYGYAGALQATRDNLVTGNPDELRRLLQTAWRHSMTVRLAGTAPRVGTIYATSYQWTDYRVLHPSHLSLTQRSTNEPGFNVHVRQPIPVVSGMIPGRLEASAELRNMLAQGYLSLTTVDGQQVLLVHAPRAVRGGLSFIF